MSLFYSFYFNNEPGRELTMHSSVSVSRKEQYMRTADLCRTQEDVPYCDNRYDSDTVMYSICTTHRYFLQWLPTCVLFQKCLRKALLKSTTVSKWDKTTKLIIQSTYEGKHFWLWFWIVCWTKLAISSVLALWSNPSTNLLIMKTMVCCRPIS